MHDQSISRARGWRTTICIAAGTMKIFEMRSCSMKSSTARGENSRATTPLAPL